MRINNAGEFYNFVVSNGLIGLAPEIGPLIVCMDEYNRMCVCDSIDARNAKLKQCKTRYIEFAKKASNYKSVLFSKTNDTFFSFCIDGQPLVTLTR